MILKIFLLWRLGLFLITYLGSRTLPQIPNEGLGAIGTNNQFDYWSSWAQWDGGHYFDIARHNYLLLSDYAFFPLYPMMVRLTNFLFDNLFFSGLLVSNLSLLFFLYIFYNLLKDKYSPQLAYLAVITFLTFPTTFFAVSFYSESLFLLFVSLTFWFLKSKNFLLASIFTSLSSLTRLVGITLAISELYSYLSDIKFDFKKLDRRIIYAFLSFLGFLVYGIYLFAKLNDPLKFLSVQSFWQRSVTDPLSTSFFYIWPMITLQSRPLNDYFDFGISVIFIGILISGVKKIPSSWWIFSLLVILIPASSGTLTSMPRYVLSSLGAFVIIGGYFINKPKLRIVFWSVSLFAQAVLASLFINGHWVA